MKAIIIPAMALFSTFLMGAEDMLGAGQTSAGLFMPTLPFTSHWSVGLTPYSGNRSPSFGNPDQAGTEYGLQMGAYWELSKRVRVSIEMPYALGRFPAVGATFDPAALIATSTEVEPRLAGTLTLSFQF